MKAGIQAIIQKIGTDAARRSSELYERAISEIDEKYDSETQIYLDEFSRQREALNKHGEHEREMANERLRSRQSREILTYKRILVDKIFALAAAKLRAMSKNEFFLVFKSAIKALGGRYNLSLGEFSAGMLDPEQIGEAAQEAGGEAQIALCGEPVAGKSGFVLWDDRVEYSCLFEDLVEDLKNELSAKVRKEVFGDGA